MSLTRGILRYGVIAGLALGGLVVLTDADRVAAGIAQIRSTASEVLDNCIEDPVALRHQLERLADEYPDRIAEVRGELAEVDHQIGEFQRDVDIAKRVVGLTTDDLQGLKALVERAEVAQSAQLTSSRALPVTIRYDGNRYSIDEAYAEGRRINDVRTRYEDRLAHDETQLQFLAEQRDRLNEILVTLETEFESYQEQLWQLDRQIDAIERNDRLIELTERQQATLDSFERYGKVENLSQIEAKLAEMRAVQEAQLRHLANRGTNRSYEDRALTEIDGRNPSNPFETIEIAPEDEHSADEAAEIEVKSVAFADPIVIR